MKWPSDYYYLNGTINNATQQHNRRRRYHPTTNKCCRVCLQFEGLPTLFTFVWSITKVDGLKSGVTSDTLSKWNWEPRMKTMSKTAPYYDTEWYCYVSNCTNLLQKKKISSISIGSRLSISSISAVPSTTFKSWTPSSWRPSRRALKSPNHALTAWLSVAWTGCLALISYILRSTSFDGLVRLKPRHGKLDCLYSTVPLLAASRVKLCEPYWAGESTRTETIKI